MRNLNYEEAIDFLNGKSNFNSAPGLGRMEKVLKNIASPEKSLKIIHVAGTNGKGSVCSMLSSILIDGGYSVGLYTSPHLEVYNERFKINNKNISNEELAEIVSFSEKAYKKLNFDSFNTFEFLTVCAFKFFFDKKVDILILETGLGGKMDATNIIANPILSIITSIGMDHMNLLGSSIEEITKEKGGIIKKNCPVVLYTQQKSVYNVINEICIKQNSKLYYSQKEILIPLNKNINETSFYLKNDYVLYENISIKMFGLYQIKNAALVLTACKALTDCGIKLSENNITNGLKNAVWHGRMEIMRTNPLIFLDGAHNIDGFKELENTFKLYFSDKKINILIGVLADKEYEDMVKKILPYLNKVIITKPDSNRALNPQAFKEVFYKLGKNPDFVTEYPLDALKYSVEITKKNEILCCCGSLYLIGQISNYFKNLNLIK